MSGPALAAGCDVVDVARLGAALDRRAGLLERLFTAAEIAEARRDGVEPGSAVERARLAARFAAKEATRKALRDLRLPFHAVEVRSLPDGAPELWVHGRPSDLACSLSHDAGVAMAVVVGTRERTSAAAAPSELTSERTVLASDDLPSETTSGATPPAGGPADRTIT